MLPSWDRLQDLRRSHEPAANQEPAPDITKAVAAAADRITAARVMTFGQERPRSVSKLGAVAERIAAKKAAHDAKADDWAERLDALDKREPDSFAIGDAVVSEREVDLADMERTMRTLSNLPNVASGKSQQG